jgi:hypothetical protein
MSDNILPLKYDYIASYQNTVDDLFFSLVDTSLKSNYQLIKRWLQWSNGYVPQWHANYIPTHLGRAIIQMMTQKIFDSGIKFEYTGKNMETLTWLSDRYSEESGFEDALKKMTEYGQSSGTSVLKADVDAMGTLVWNAVRQDRFHLSWAGNKIVKARFYASALFGTFQTQRLILVEERFYDKDMKPVYKYYIQIMNQSSNTNQWSAGNRIDSLDTLKGETLDYVAQKLGNKKLDTEYPLPFSHLGIYAYQNSITSAFFDGLHLGDSTLASAIELIAEYDKTYTLMTIDLQNGRGQVLVPDDMIPKIDKAETNEFYSYMSAMQQMFNQTIYKKMPFINPEDQKPISIQFELRSSEWQTSLNTQLQEILVRVMASPSSIAPHLGDYSQKTATEINAIEHNTVSYIMGKRDTIKRIANRALKDIFDFYKKEGEAFIMFNAAGLNNDQQRSDKAIREFNAGIRSKWSTIRECNPGWTTAEVQEELEKLNEENMPLADEEILL